MLHYVATPFLFYVLLQVPHAEQPEEGVPILIAGYAGEIPLMATCYVKPCYQSPSINNSRLVPVAHRGYTKGQQCVMPYTS